MSSTKVDTYDTEITINFPAGSVRQMWPSPSTSSPTSTTTTTTTSLIPGIDPAYIVGNAIPPQSNFAVLPHWHESYTEYFHVSHGYVLLRLGQKHIIVGPGENAVIPAGAIHGFSRADISLPGWGSGGFGLDSADEAWRERRAAKTGAGGSGETDDDDDERNGAWTAEDVVMHEGTTPSDGFKEVFFRNTLSLIRDWFQPLLLEAGDLQRRRGSGAVGLPGFILGMAWVGARVGARAPKVIYSVSHMDMYLLLVDDRYGREKPGVSLVAGGKDADEWDGPSRKSRFVTNALFAVVGAVGKFLGWKIWREEYTPERLRGIAKTMK